MAYNLLKVVWSQLLCAIIAAVGTWYILSNHYEKRQEKAVAVAISAEKENCTKLNQITEGVSNEYREKLASTRHDLNRTKRMFQAMPCAPVATLSSRDSGGTNLQRGLSGTDGVSTDSLFTLSGNARESALKRQYCKAFVDKLYGR